VGDGGVRVSDVRDEADVATVAAAARGIGGCGAGRGPAVLIVVVAAAAFAFGLPAGGLVLLVGCSFGVAGVAGMLVLVAELGRSRQRIEVLAERERALEHSGRQQLASVSHDLRTPIARMRAMAEALDDGIVDEPAEVRLFHMRLVGEVDRLGQLVDGLLQRSRTDNVDGNRRGNNGHSNGAGPESVPLCELVSDAVASATVVAESKGVRLDSHLTNVDHWPSVAGPASELTRVVHNLLDNAIRHTPPGGAVDVAVETGSSPPGEPARWIAAVSVHDQCGGIPDDELDRIFDVAYQGDTTRTPAAHPGGAGLGLSIARSLVEAHAGTLTVHNDPPGCCFTITLPLT
jgi:signal transduction histidine kinase